MLREGPGGRMRIAATILDPGGMELGAPGPDPMWGNPLLHGEGEDRLEQRNTEIELK